ncbi:MAG: o-succinylbenzoate synthase [bacterium]
MKIDRIELHHLRLKLVDAFQTSRAKSIYRETVLIKLHSPDGIGWGESPAAAAPFYWSENVKMVLYVIQEFLAPILLKAEINQPEEIKTIFNRIRGHNCAKTGIEAAVWNIYSEKKHIPLAKVYGGSKTTIPVGVSIGIQENINQLLTRIQTFVDKGYRKIKLKIQPGWDVAIIRQVRKTFPEINLAVDANGAYTLKDISVFEKLDQYGLAMIEQPLDYRDLYQHSILQKHLKTPICLDESIQNIYDTECAIALKSCKIINIKPARVGGFAEAISIARLCDRNHIKVWCGGLLETGIGRLHNIALASRKEFSLPGDISESKRYYEQDIVSPPIEAIAGKITVSDNIGLGSNVVEKEVKKHLVTKLILE